MRAIVTGGAGFIGSHLVDRLLELGNEVIVIDKENENSVGPFYWNGDADNYKLDACNFSDTRSLYDGVDYVFHMASDNSTRNSINNPLRTNFVNSFGTNVVLQCARESRVKRVIFSSSFSLYGDNNLPSVETQNEEYNTPYDLSKLFGEKLCKLYSSKFKTDTIILRYSSVYGERERKSGQYFTPVEKFRIEKEKNKSLIVLGDGSERRDLIHVSDIVEANIRAAKIKLDKQYSGDIFNIGSGKNYSIDEIAKMYNYDISYRENNGISIRSMLLDIEKAKNVLNWQPRVDLRLWLEGRYGNTN
jgi:UDP-glucose 4-epimerase